MKGLQHAVGYAMRPSPMQSALLQKAILRAPIPGGICPEGYFQISPVKREARADLLEMRTYCQIGLSGTPLVMLGCGYFPSAETLDGHTGIAEVYIQDKRGECAGLRDVLKL
ncbi:hypothetical protein FGG08_001666 [Glutinoglossum americanum]|uniref:Uncharacterized protein n=1 Tax=Glutinoglossum americanum TaxID=1670608 RepID=A0A9P8I6E1_9PEZI|nr:hypothetical protein FGG08_001666 [Glutinoglossum americanum]